MSDTWPVASDEKDLDDFLESGHQAFLQGKWVDASAAFRDALRLKGVAGKGAPTSAERLRAQVITSQVRVKLGHCLRMMGRIDEAKEEFEQVKAFAEEMDNQHLLGEALLGLGFVNWRTGEHDKGKELFKKVIEMGDKTHDSVLKGRAFTGLGSIALVLRRLDEGVEAYETALKLLRGADEAKQDLGRLTHNLAFLLLKQGELEKSEKMFKRALKLSDDLGDVHTAGFAYANLAHLHVISGRLEEAEDHLERAGRLLARTNDKIGLNLVVWVRGLLRFKQGDVEGAIVEYRKARKGYEEMGLRTQVFHMTMDYVPVFKAAGMKKEIIETLDKINASIQEKGFSDLMEKLLEKEKMVKGKDE